MDVQKKAAETGRNARLNPDAEQEEKVVTDSDALRDERAVARPHMTVNEEKPARIIFLPTIAAEPRQARQLPWVICVNATPNKTWLAVLKHYTLQELGEAACRYGADDKHLRQFIGIPSDIQGLNVTPNTANQIKLINNDRANAWLHLSQCTTLTSAKKKCALSERTLRPGRANPPGTPRTPGPSRS